MKIKSLAHNVFRAWLWVCLSCAGLFPECRDLDAISVLWSRVRSCPTCQPGLFAPSQESTAMPSLSSLCFTSKWDPQPKRTEDFVSDSPARETAEISRFPTSWQNFPCVSKTPGKGFVHRLWAGGGEDIAWTVQGNAASSGYCQQGDTGSALHWKAKLTEIKNI